MLFYIRLGRIFIMNANINSMMISLKQFIEHKDVCFSDVMKHHIKYSLLHKRYNKLKMIFDATAFHEETEVISMIFYIGVMALSIFLFLYCFWTNTLPNFMLVLIWSILMGALIHVVWIVNERRLQEHQQYLNMFFDFQETDINQNDFMDYLTAMFVMNEENKNIHSWYYRMRVKDNPYLNKKKMPVLFINQINDRLLHPSEPIQLKQSEILLGYQIKKQQIQNHQENIN